MDKNELQAIQEQIESAQRFYDRNQNYQAELLLELARVRLLGGIAESLERIADNLEIKPAGLWQPAMEVKDILERINP